MCSTRSRQSSCLQLLLVVEQGVPFLQQRSVPPTDTCLMPSCLQVVSRQTNFCVHFLQLTGPEAELQAAASELQDQQQQHDQPGPATAAEDASTDAAFHQMLKVMARGGNITYDAFVAGVVSTVAMLLLRRRNGCCKHTWDTRLSLCMHGLLAGCALT